MTRVAFPNIDLHANDFWTSVDCRLPGRGERVVALLGAVACLGLADLALTLTFMGSIGMPEGNPAARAAANFGPLGVTGLKVITSVVNIAILFAIRRRPVAELAAVASVAIMLGIGAHWLDMLRFVETENFPCIAAALESDPTWVRFR
jgi:hypothetical protein